MIRIGVDMISAGSGLNLGIEGMRYYYEGLMDGLTELDDENNLVAFLPRASQDFCLPGSRKLDLVECPRVPSGRFGRATYLHVVLPAIARAHSIDVLLSTVNVGSASWRGPSVVVLQSLQTFILPDRNRARHAYLKTVMPASLRRADRVIAVSEATRVDAIRLFGLNPERVVTVHHGCPKWAQQAAARYRQQGRPPIPPPLEEVPYVLNVSALYGLKNHRRLILAFAEVVRQSKLPHHLVLAGGEADIAASELHLVARSAGVESRVQILGRYPQEHLPALYAKAEAVAYPSLYETFGLPVLETFAFERPLLTSNTGGSAELAGDAAVKVDPEDVASIAEGLRQILEDEALRQRLVEAGRRRLEDFSWERCARETRSALSAAVEARRGRRVQTAGQRDQSP